MSKRKSNSTSFRKGKPKTGGRKAGTPNKKTRVIKEAMLLAAEAIGDEKGDGGLFGFMKLVGIEHPPHLMAGLVRMIPQQVETKEVSPERVCRTSAEIRQKLIKRGRVPVHMIHPALTDEADETEETDGTDKTKPDKPDKPDKTDDNSGEQQH